MSTEYVICPICGEKNFMTLPQVNPSETYKNINCPHLLYMPFEIDFGYDFLTALLKDYKNDPETITPGLHPLNLGVIPEAVLETKKGKIKQILASNIHEVKGWWFGTTEELEKSRKDLFNLLKPICDSYSTKSK